MNTVDYGPFITQEENSSQKADEERECVLINIAPCVDVQYSNDVLFHLIDNSIFSDS
jgi:hypothetical protein